MSSGIESPNFSTYQTKEREIFARNRGELEQYGDNRPLVLDPGVAPQSAFLVSWRFGRRVTDLVSEFSEEVAAQAPALTYDERNLHVTISDLNLTTDKVIDPERNTSDGDILESLVASVTRVCSKLSFTEGRKTSVDFADALIMGGKSVVLAGSSNEHVYKINQDILAAASGNPATQLKGTWGGHMTTNRFLRDSSLAEAQRVAERVRAAPKIGAATPTAIEVGYFNTDTVNGFVLKTIRRFDIF